MDTLLTIMVAAVSIAAQESGNDVATTLRGSPESMARQHAVAVQEGHAFVGTLEEMELLVEEGKLVPIRGGDHYEVMDWVFPYALPAVRTFVELFSMQYHRACGEPLVVTSLTRPFSEQPPNSHQLSVHPAGMAVDLRISQSEACRQYLESSLLELEERGLLDITRERSPPHYHVAIFPEPFAAWAAMQTPLDQPDDGDIGPAGQTVGWTLLILLVLAVAVGAAYAIRSRRAG